MSKINKEKLDLINDKISKVYEDVWNYEGDQFIVSYYHKDELIGYHASSQCEVTTDRNVAKRYMGDNPEQQLASINSYLKTVLETKESDLENIEPLVAFFIQTRLNVKKTYFHNMKIEDIYLNYEYLNGSETRLSAQTRIY